MTPVFEPPPVTSTGLYDNFVLNPVEFTPELPEVDLRDGGIQIGPGAPNLGEATVNVERVKKLIGEGVTGRQLGTVECEIPLLASIDRSISQAAAYEPLEAFVGDVQMGRIRWIRHDVKDVGEFSGSLATFVDNASIPKPFGGEVDELTLHLSRHPIWYATTEILAGEASGSEVRDLEFTIAELLGTAPGLIRLVLKNEGTEDWRGCMVAFECDSYSSADTAKPKYEAKELTPKGGAEVKTVSGAEVVKCPPLTAGWQTVLSSEIVADGHMTHVDPRRLVFRLNDPSSVLDDVQWKAEWRQNGQAAWVQTMEASTPIVKSSPVIGGYQLLDLGEARPERPITGGPRFEWRLQGRSLSGSGKQPLIRDFYPMTTEQWQRVQDTSEAPVDGEPTKTPGTVEDATGVGTVTWGEPNNAKIRDSVNVSGTYATAFNSSASEAKTSHFLKATNFEFAIPAGATILGIAVKVNRAFSNLGGGEVLDANARIVKGGTIKTTEDKAATSVLWPHTFQTASYGGSADLWGNTWSVNDINSSGFGFALAVSLSKSSGVTAKVDVIEITVAYAEGANLNRVCFASRSVEFSDMGLRRQHVTDEVWGELIPNGLDLQAPVPGQAAQPVRAIVIPSVGDFEGRADAAPAKLNAKLYYRPAYLSAREAA